MKRQDLEKWIKVLKEKNPLGMPTIMFDALLEDSNEIKVSLQTARFIYRLLPSEYEEALNIYVETLTDKNIKQALLAIQGEDINDILEDLNESVEEVIWGYMNTGIILEYQKDDVETALKYIEKGIKMMNAHPVELKYISKGEVYYTYWRILERAGKLEQVFAEVNKLL